MCCQLLHTSQYLLISTNVLPPHPKSMMRWIYWLLGWRGLMHASRQAPQDHLKLSILFQIKNFNLNFIDPITLCFLWKRSIKKRSSRNYDHLYQNF